MLIVKLYLLIFNIINNIDINENNIQNYLYENIKTFKSFKNDIEKINNNDIFNNIV